MIFTFTGFTLSDQKGTWFVPRGQKQSLSLSPTQVLEKPSVGEENHTLYVYL